MVKDVLLPVLIILLQSSVHFVSSLTCLFCDDTFLPRHCKTVKQCGADEVCFVERFTNSFHEARYRVGCRNSKVCQQQLQHRKSLSLLRSNPVSCVTCCDSDLCNAEGCGVPGYPSPLPGPICYACISGSNTCHSIAFCQQHEVCMISKTVEFGDVVYTTGCQQTSECPLDDPHPLLRYNATLCAGSPCHMCCRRDLCNDVLRNVRLAGIGSNDEGRLEVNVNGIWGTVCADHASKEIAEVACRQLGYSLDSVTVSIKGNATYGQGDGHIVMDEVQCRGDEQSLQQCIFTENPSGCSHKEDLGVVCRETTYPFRLANTTKSNEGRLEMKVNGTWSLVCDDHFTHNSASVACHMFGFNRAGAIAVSRSHFGIGTKNQKFVLDEVRCRGTENSLMDCEHRSLGHTDCNEFDSVGIICEL